MVAKIVTHYGSEVQMKLEDDTYNAGVSLDLFRANEKLNAFKKRYLTGEVHKLGYHNQHENRPIPHLAGPDVQKLTDCPDRSDLYKSVHSVIQTLFTQKKIVLYERDHPVEDIVPLDEESTCEYICRALVHLLTVGNIDVIMDIYVTFSGDSRVLRDIKLLADSGYGEDDFGNNLPLPDELSYLRK